MINSELAQKNHERGLWSDEMLEKLVQAQKITKVDKENIIKNSKLKKK